MRKDDSQFHDDDADRRLWQRFGETTSSPDTPEPDDLDPNDLAAYLDGTAAPDLVKSIEQKLASDSQLFETVIELQQIRDAVGSGNDPAVPATVTSTAKGLVGQTPTLKHDETPATLYHINWSRLQWAAAAAFVLTAGWSGYSTGLNAYTSTDVTNTLADTDAPALVFDLEGILDEPAMAWVDAVAGGEL